MIKYRLIFSSVLFIFLILLGILIWRASTLFTNLAALSFSVDTGLEPSTKTTRHKKTISLNESPQITDNSTDHSKHDHYESIEETIARIKKDVIVTGTITGVSGQESAIFQIEGMPDRSFNINTQLMDGFIITEITNNQVILKNQIGAEFFSMTIQSGKLSKLMEPDSFEPGSVVLNSFESGSLKPDELEPRSTEPGKQ